MDSVEIFVHQGDDIALVPPELYGSFVEHLGRAVYTGIYEPEHPKADENGFREDVAELVKELGVSAVRYPGGNFVSGYNWRDGVGPRTQRPVRLDLAWQSSESNRFGVGEFILWCRKLQLTPHLALNLGTGSPKEAAELIEYCNHPYGTALSDLRRSHGFAQPFEIHLCCLGNEMDVKSQIGHLPAREYALKAQQTATMLRNICPEIRLTACGSASTTTSTYPQWDREVLEILYDDVAYLSCHQYYENSQGDAEEYLRSYLRLQDLIDTASATINYVKALHRSDKQVYLSLDEWGIWSMTGEPWQDYFTRHPQQRFAAHPPLLEQSYTLLDALVTGGLLCTLLLNCDKVKVACLAQLVNVIAPILTQEGGGVLRQSIFYPFKLFATYGRGIALRPFVRSAGTISATALQVAAVQREACAELCFFVLNTQDAPVHVSLKAEGFGYTELISHSALFGPDLQARNTFDNPQAVAMQKLPLTPQQRAEGHAQLPPYSLNLLRLKSS
ncbi:MAG: alpha-N-arabinofuranosidase [Succinivibrio sp.]|nr:alpha-N-arabinofuranosidase [Succinivibrio sp.]